MNKNTPILEAEYDTNANGFTRIYEVLNIDFAPLIIEKQYRIQPDALTASISKWFRGRGIPSWRDRLDVLLARLGVQTPEELLDKSFGLSLADQYWLKPIDFEIRYDDINFFDHDFDTADFLEASFSDSSERQAGNVSLHSPNNTTDGMLRKAWIVENDKRYLLKSGYKGDTLQPFNEVLASKICEKLNFSHIEYTLSEAKGKIVSKCECFTTKDTEIIPAYQILYGHEKQDGFKDYERYIELLETKGIADARTQMENMLVLDFLIMNEDRHLNNVGAVRDVNTLEWLSCMPIFDNGQALNVLSYGTEGIAIRGEGQFFHDTLSFDKIITAVKNFQRFDFGKLDGISEGFRQLLTNNMVTSRLTTERIDALCKVLDGQIAKIRGKQA